MIWYISVWPETKVRFVTYTKSYWLLTEKLDKETNYTTTRGPVGHVKQYNQQVEPSSQENVSYVNGKPHKYVLIKKNIYFFNEYFQNTLILGFWLCMLLTSFFTADVCAWQGRDSTHVTDNIHSVSRVQGGSVGWLTVGAHCVPFLCATDTKLLAFHLHSHTSRWEQPRVTQATLLRFAVSSDVSINKDLFKSCWHHKYIYFRITGCTQNMWDFKK